MQVYLTSFPCLFFSAPCHPCLEHVLHAADCKAALLEPQVVPGYQRRQSRDVTVCKHHNAPERRVCTLAVIELLLSANDISL